MSGANEFAFAHLYGVAIALQVLLQVAVFAKLKNEYGIVGGGNAAEHAYQMLVVGARLRESVLLPRRRMLPSKSRSPSTVSRGRM